MYVSSRIADQIKVAAIAPFFNAKDSGCEAGVFCVRSIFLYFTK